MRRALVLVPLFIAASLIVFGCGKQLPTQLDSNGPGRASGSTSIFRTTCCDFQIGDFVWNDLNKDGIQDPGEPGIAGVRLDLFNAANELVATVITGPDGSYRFYEVCAGDYRVVVTPPAGDCTPTKVNATNVYFDSNPNPALLTLVDAGNTTIDFGFVCDGPQVDCGPCKGKVTSLSLQYNGGVADARVVVQMKKPKINVFNGIVQPGETFSFTGADKSGTLGTDIIVLVNGRQNAAIHTSCSQPIGPGLARGDFEVVAGTSLSGGPLCPLPPVPPGGDDFCETYGRPRGLAFQYTAKGCGATHHSQAAGKVICADYGTLPATARIVVTNNSTAGASGALVYFDGTIISGQSFTMSGANAGQTTLSTNSWAYIYSGSTLVEKVQFHTSCSQPLIRGDEYGSLLLEGFTP